MSHEAAFFFYPNSPKWFAPELRWGAGGVGVTWGRFGVRSACARPAVWGPRWLVQLPWVPSAGTQWTGSGERSCCLGGTQLKNGVLGMFVCVRGNGGLVVLQQSLKRLVNAQLTLLTAGMMAKWSPSQNLHPKSTPQIPWVWGWSRAHPPRAAACPRLAFPFPSPARQRKSPNPGRDRMAFGS